MNQIQYKEKGCRYYIENKKDTMTQNFTLNDLILFYYDELSEVKATSVALALEFDDDLMQEYKQLQETTAILNTENQSPSAFSIQYIMSYSSDKNPSLNEV